jgi:hypothetical protein
MNARPDQHQDRDPCSGCRALVSRDGIRPYCERATFYGQVGCLRKSGPQREWRGERQGPR